MYSRLLLDVGIPGSIGSSFCLWSLHRDKKYFFSIHWYRFTLPLKHKLVLFAFILLLLIAMRLGRPGHLCQCDGQRENLSTLTSVFSTIIWDTSKSKRKKIRSTNLFCFLPSSGLGCAQVILRKKKYIFFIFITLALLSSVVALTKISAKTCLRVKDVTNFFFRKPVWKCSAFLTRCVVMLCICWKALVVFVVLFCVFRTVWLAATFPGCARKTDTLAWISGLSLVLHYLTDADGKLKKKKLMMFMVTCLFSS